MSESTFTSHLVELAEGWRSLRESLTQHERELHVRRHAMETARTDLKEAEVAHSRADLANMSIWRDLEEAERTLVREIKSFEKDGKRIPSEVHEICAEHLEGVDDSLGTVLDRITGRNHTPRTSD